MPRTDPEFQRVAQALDVFTLRRVDNDDAIEEDRFLDFYSPEGLHNGLRAYGIAERMRAAGLGDFKIEVTREDPYHHRLEFFVGLEKDDDHRILDLRIHLCDVVVPLRDGERSFRAMRVDWLTMQNPRVQFTSTRPMLPGQSHPGTGLGRAMHNMLVIMATRIGRDALVVVPAHFHLARLYHRAAYRFAALAHNREIEDVTMAIRDVSFAAGAWAVDRGFVVDADSGVPYRYVARDMVLPLGVELKETLRWAAEIIRGRITAAVDPRFTLDRAGLLTSFLETPVPGIDADDLAPRFF